MKVLYLPHGDPDVKFSQVLLIAGQYLLNLKNILLNKEIPQYLKNNL